MTLRITTVATLLLLAATAHVIAEGKPAEVPAIVLDPAMDWWAGSDTAFTNETSRNLVQLDRENRTARFRALDSAASAVWVTYFGSPISWRSHPIMVMRYRANQLRDDAMLPLLRVHDEPGGTALGRPVWGVADLQADGREHEVRRDLRTIQLHDEGLIRGLKLGISAGDGEAEFELLTLRFEQAPDSPPVPIVQEELVPITVKVVDHDDKPIAGATITLDPERLNESRSVMTNDEGLATITPVKTEGQTFLRPVVSKRGMATVIGFIDLKKFNDRPYVALLSPAQPIGGTVVNERNEPVAGAMVQPRYLSRADWLHSTKWSYTRLPATVFTDEHGRWVSEPVVTGATTITGTILHPDYAAEDWAEYSSDEAVEPFYSRKVVHVLSSGVTVTGTVLAHDGLPVAGAFVLARDGRNSNLMRGITTDSQGRFRFDRTRHGDMSLTATAKGHGPALVKLMVDADTPPQSLRLDKPHTVRFRVVNVDGNPIPKAHIQATSWRELNTVKWTSDVDHDGRAAWTEAPSDSVNYWVHAEGYQSPSAELRPGDVEHTITLLNPVRISGNVTDAETGEAVQRFKVIPGDNIFADQGIISTPNWEHDRATIGTNGRYELKLDYLNSHTQLRLEADDYRPVVSRVLRRDEGNITLDFKLERGGPLTGTVLGGDGNAVADATVILIANRLFASITNGREVRRHKSDTVATTDTDGRFEFPMMEKEEIKLVALHEAGYVEVKLMPGNEPVELKLMPWGRIEGLVHIKGTPVAGQKVSSYTHGVQTPSGLDVFHHLNTVTDDQGRFVFDRVAPGDYPVGSMAQSAPAEVEAGKTATVSLECSGRPLLGRFVLPAGFDKPLPWDTNRAHFSKLRYDLQPRITMPDQIATMSPKELDAWYKNWYDGDEGRAYVKVMRQWMARAQSFSVDIQPGGSFHVPHVPSGTYRMFLQQYRDGFTAKIEKRITIPPIESDHDNEPFNLGDIELAIAGSLNVGDKAPDFELPTLDGKTVKLSSLRGKYVLLDFWATWCGPCVAETPNLKDVYATFGDHPRFAMIALSQDSDEKAPRDYAAKHALGWTQAFLTDEHKSKVTAAYGIQGIPSFFLIGPDGRVAAKGMRGKAIKEAVAQALQ